MILSCEPSPGGPYALAAETLSLFPAHAQYLSNACPRCACVPSCLLYRCSAALQPTRFLPPDEGTGQVTDVRCALIMPIGLVLKWWT